MNRLMFFSCLRGKERRPEAHEQTNVFKLLEREREETRGT